MRRLLETLPTLRRNLMATVTITITDITDTGTCAVSVHCYPPREEGQDVTPAMHVALIMAESVQTKYKDADDESVS
jgi:hypothetical protein